MERRVINPWDWQEEFAHVQAVEVSGSGRTLYCAGQTSVDEAGSPVHVGDMRAQLTRALENLEVVPSDAAFDLSHVVRLNIYTTEMEAAFASYDALAGPLREAECRQTGVLIGVARLAHSDLLVELEATAVADYRQREQCLAICNTSGRSSVPRDGAGRLHPHRSAPTSRRRSGDRHPEQEGLSPDRTIIDHLDNTEDLDLHREVADRGVFVEYDHIGRDYFAYEWGYGHSRGHDACRATFAKTLIDEGQGHQLLFSQDTSQGLGMLR